MADLDKRLAVLGPHVHEGVPLSRAADAGVPIRTARRWRAAYEADGATGLARVSRTDRGGHRVSAEMRALIEDWRCVVRHPAPRRCTGRS